MRRELFVHGFQSPHIFPPSVGEIWTCYGEYWLLVLNYGEGFRTIRIDGKATLNFNKLDHFKNYKFFQTATREEIEEIKKKYKEAIEGEMSLAI